MMVLVWTYINLINGLKEIHDYLELFLNAFNIYESEFS